MAHLSDDIEKLEYEQAAKFLQAYLECSDEVQAVVRDMLEILKDPKTDPDDRDMAVFTLADALFPKPHDGKLGMDLEESERMGASFCDETRHVLEEFDQEEATFAARLKVEMQNAGVSQQQLAKRLGIGQPAVSNMLNRQCRPQRRTVARVAEALGVQPQDLWPNFTEAVK